LNVKLKLIRLGPDVKSLADGRLARHPLGHLEEVRVIAACREAAHDEPEGDDGQPGDDQNQEYRALRLPITRERGHDLLAPSAGVPAWPWRLDAEPDQPPSGWTATSHHAPERRFTQPQHPDAGDPI
jgi:hypothetical protein